MRERKYLQRIHLVLLSLFLALYAHSAWFGVLAQNEPPIEQPPEIGGIVPLLSDREYFLSIAVLIFGILVIASEVYLLRNSSDEPRMILLVIVTTIIVLAGLFIITAGLSTEQVAPAFGLYGAIVGYLLGKEGGEKQK
ncbi:hypothetical protein [Acaryochloris sp. IP29b_bin.148]|uniref:hypothetical protein n=1 Tax=Acaryochloris sp. IP29b_bin.148 TaxID=2969218 RepID=UPI00262ADCE0|nr:hypothetical protein [Acaryochloris sp. IP29b_bin.148]